MWTAIGLFLKGVAGFIWTLAKSKVFWAILGIALVLASAMCEGYHLAKDVDAKTISDLNAQITTLTQKDKDDVKAIKDKWDEQNLADAKETAKKTVALEQAHQKIEGDLNAKVATIQHERDAALNSASVLSRQTRPTTPTAINPAAPITDCTGLQLFREDSQFLIRQASLSDQVVAERDACYAQYQKVSEISMAVNTVAGTSITGASEDTPIAIPAVAVPHVLEHEGDSQSPLPTNSETPQIHHDANETVPKTISEAIDGATKTDPFG